MSPFPSSDWLESAVTALEADEQFLRYSRAFDATIRFDFGDDAYAVSIDDGNFEVHEDPTYVAWDVALRADEGTWRKTFSETPPAPYTDLLGAWLCGDTTVEGDLKTAIQHLRPLKRMIEVFRAVSIGDAPSSRDDPALSERVAATDAVTTTADFEHGETEPVDGHYVWLEFEEETYRTYYETTGDGDVPLVCLHTAGADSRQYRHLLNDQSIHEKFTLYALDIPWHGRTFPPMNADWWTDDYRLTTEFYAGFIMRFVRALDLERPAVLGCSMGGAIILKLANAYADKLRAVIGLETTAHAATRDIGYLDHPHINGEVIRAEWTYGLQAPQSPEQFKRESWWTYSQSGPGVYSGDIYFYATDWDAREEVSEIDTDECGVYLLTGEYDYSASPEDTHAVAEKIDGAYFEEMDGLGHFPMVENPALLEEYLDPVLERIAAE